MKNHVKVKVSVNCLIENDGKILLVQEAVGKIRGLWSVPGGKVDEGESFAEAVLREVKEETDLDVLSSEEIIIIQEEPDHTAKHIFKVKAKGTLKPQVGEILDVQWFSLKEMREMKEKLRKPWVLEIAKEYFKQ